VVGVLISMKFAMLRHSPRGMRIFGWVVGALLVAATWAAALLAEQTVRGQVVMLALVLWLVGAAFGPVTMSGAGVLRPEFFALLPLDRRRLALGLLAATFPGVASGYVLLAGLVLLVPAVAGGAGVLGVLVALLGAVLTWVLMLTLSRVVYSLLGAAMRTRLGVEISALQFGLLIGSMFAGWIVISQAFVTIPALLRSGVGEAATVLAWFPSSWALNAVEAVAAGGAPAALAWLAMLAAAAGALLVAAAALLRTDVGGASARRQRRPLGSRVMTGRAVLPTTAVGAVVGKELRQWWRDPWRSLELRSAIWTGVVVGLFALAAPWTREIAPLAGLIVATMVALGGCNLYGQDGTALWLTIVGQRAGTVRADVRGRQISTILLFAVPAVAVSTVFTAVVGVGWATVAVAALLPALFGVASGVSVMMSAVGVSPGVDPRRRVGPNDAGGDLGLQVQVALWATVVLAAPTIVAVVLTLTGAIGDDPGVVPWWVFAIGVLNGAAGFWLLGRAAIGYLRNRLPTVFSQIRYRRNDDEGGGALAGFARTSQKFEDEARAAKEKERREKVGARHVPDERT
jgi:ABC-2 type transport system permease protein